MASLVYAVWSITNVASVHCAVRPEISPCTCEPVYANNYVELSCEKVDSFHQIVDALSNKFEPYVNISLKISHSQLEDLEMRSFTDMNMNVVKLKMQWNKLRSFPELPFRGLSNVEFLSISDNDYDEIPKHMLNHMPIVKSLDMGRCRIRSVFQEDLRGVQMVTNLFLPINNITRIDKGAFPSGLVILHLGRNQIESLNGTLRDLNNLESLFINMNSIQTLENELPESNRLKLILAQNNRLERLPESMRRMTNLETLHLQFNRLKSLDGIFRDAKNLNTFYVYNNEITFVAQDEFQACETMEELNMAFNNIKSLNHSLLPLAHLSVANFSFNDIEEFSMNEIRGLKHLKQLDLSYNSILKLTGSQENNIDQNSFLIEFNLDHNQLKSLDGALMGLNSLRILSLSFNQIERILPDDFIGLVKLEILDLSHNQLLTLKEMETTFLPRLKILKIPYNNLTKLEKDFYGLPVLCQANLANNQISSISTELVSQTRCMNHNVPGKLELHLDGNPILCDERLNELCPIMLAQDARIRGHSPCFDDDQEVCTVLPMIYKRVNIDLPILLKQSPPNAKNVILVLNNQLKNQEDLLPPLIAKLGPPLMKPLIIAATTGTTTTTTSTSAPVLSTEKNNELPLERSVLPREETENYSNHNNSPIKPTLAGLVFGDKILTTLPTTTTNGTPINFDENKADNVTSALTTTPKIETIKPEEPPLVLDIEEVVAPEPYNIPLKAVLSQPDGSGMPAVINADDTAGKAGSTAVASTSGITAALVPPTAPQTEYATVEYIPNLHEFMPGGESADHSSPAQLPPLDVDVDALAEDSKSNSVHGEFPSVVLADLDNAPQSLILPKEPPENLHHLSAMKHHNSPLILTN